MPYDQKNSDERQTNPAGGAPHREWVNVKPIGSADALSLGESRRVMFKLDACKSAVALHWMSICPTASRPSICSIDRTNWAVED